MIKYTDSHLNTVMFVIDIDSEFKSFLTRNRLSKPDGTPYKGITISKGSTYQFTGSNTHLPAHLVTKKDGSKHYFVSKNIKFDDWKDKTSSNLVTFFNTYGYDSVLNLDNLSLNGMWNRSGDNLEIDSTIFELTSSSDLSTDYIHNFIHKMKTDNGRMISPLTEKFLVVVRLVRRNASRFTGYANIETYLKRMNIPSTLFQGKNVSDNKRLEFIDTPVLTVEAAGINSISINVSGISIADTSNNKPNAYILLTLKPITLGGAKLPFFTIRYSDLMLFVSPLIMTNDNYLRNLEGGINLLK